MSAIQGRMRSGLARKAVVTSITLTLALLVTSVILAADGDLDTTFGTDGKVTTNISGGFDMANGVAMQADGKIVVVGSSDSGIAVARYNSDGSLDTTFNGDGIVTHDFGGPWDQGLDVAVQDDGKIVVVGQTHIDTLTNFAALRYNSDGTLDTGFGSSGTGYQLTNFGEVQQTETTDNSR